MRRAVVATAVAALLAAALALALANRAPRRFADSEGYLWAAAQPLGFDFFASNRSPFELGPTPAPQDGLYRNRPWLVPLLYRLCGLDPVRVVQAQGLLYATGVAIGLALLIAAARAGASRVPRFARLLAALPLIALALAWYVAGWTGVLLSESLVLTLAWVAAGGVAAYLAVGGPAALALAWCAGASLLFARDSGGLLALPLFAAAAIAALVLRERRRARALALAWLLLLPLFFVALATAARGHRTVLPIANVLLVRVAPDPEALDWWRARGLPWSSDLDRFRGGFAFEHDLELFREPRYAPFLAFVEERGRGLLLRFLVGHPLWTLRETWHAREDLFGTDVSTYVGPAPPLLAPIDRAARALGAGGAALLLVLWAIRIARRGRAAGADLVPFVIAAAFLCHGLAALHADAAEPERHAFPTAFGLQMAGAYVVARLLLDRRGSVRPHAAAEPA